MCLGPGRDFTLHGLFRLSLQTQLATFSIPSAKYSMLTHIVFEAGTGIEPVHIGFANRCVTTSPPGQIPNCVAKRLKPLIQQAPSVLHLLRHPAGCLTV